MLTSTKHKYGWKRQNPDHRDRRYRVPEAIARALPAKVDLDIPALAFPFNPSMDQEALGSCGPNALALIAIFEAFDEKVKPVIMPSRLFIYYCTRAIMGTIGQDSGVDNRSMMQALKKFGWCPESLWPYDIKRFTVRPQEVCFSESLPRADRLRYESVAQVLDVMKGCLADRKAILFGFSVYESFESAEVEETGDVPMPQRGEGVYGGHDVVLIGYDDALERFKFRNSWGRAWGKEGNGTFPYAFATNSNYADNFWTIRSLTGDEPLPPDPEPYPPVPIPPVVPIDLKKVHADINAILDTVETNYPFFLDWAVNDARRRIDGYFDAMPKFAFPLPPEMIVVIAGIFDSLILAAKNPLLKMILTIAKSAVMAYLSAMK